MGCLSPLAKEKAEIFRKLWSPPQRMIKSLEGRIVNSRGLGFVEIDDDAFRMLLLEIQPEDPRAIEVKNAPKELEEGGQSTIDELTEIHLGSEDNPTLTLACP